MSWKILRRWFSPLAFAFFVVLAAGPPAVRADEVRLKNGDRISGTIVTMEDKVLTIRTSYAGELSIQWEAVAGITTETPIEVGLSDDTSGRGLMSTDEKGKMSIEAEKIEAPLTFNPGDVESINPGPDYRWLARFNVGIEIEKGNTDQEEYDFSGSYFARTEKSRYMTRVEYSNEYKSGSKTEDKGMALLKYNHFLDQEWYGWLGGYFEMDKFKDLNLRSVGGLGPGYQFFETPLTNLSIEAGLAGVNEDFDVGEDQNYPATIWGVNYDRYLLDEMVQFFHWQMGIWSLSDAEDIAVYARTGVRVPLFKSLSVTLQYNLNWDNAVPPDEDEVDQRLLFTLGWEFSNLRSEPRALRRLDYVRWD
jgi:putative salt-induced outer membrane protein YdiY